MEDTGDQMLHHVQRDQAAEQETPAQVHGQNPIEILNR